jgi:hypothetical protein
VAEILIQRKRRRRVLWPWVVLGFLVLALLPWPFLDDRNEPPAARARIAQRDTVARRDTTAVGDPAARPAAAGGAAGSAAAAPSVARTTATAAGVIAPTATAAPTAAAPKAETLPVAPTPASPSATSFERFVATRDPNPDERTHRRYTATALHRLADELRTLGASEAGVRAIHLNADSVMSTARGRARPDYARTAFLAAVREIDVLGGRYRVAVDTGRLRTAAWAIKPDGGLLAQRARVQTFFETARDALRSLSRRRR